MLNCLHVTLIAYSVMFSPLKRNQRNSDSPCLHWSEKRNPMCILDYFVRCTQQAKVWLNLFKWPVLIRKLRSGSAPLEIKQPIKKLYFVVLFKQ